MKTKEEEVEKKFNDALDELKIYEKLDRSLLKNIQSEEYIVNATNSLIQSGKVYIFIKKHALKFGSTWPVFEDSYIFPECHMVRISITNLLVLTHELAHIIDFERKASDPHDKTFMEIWRGLCIKSLEFLKGFEKTKWMKFYG